MVDSQRSWRPAKISTCCNAASHSDMSGSCLLMLRIALAWGFPWLCVLRVNIAELSAWCRLLFRYYFKCECDDFNSGFVYEEIMSDDSTLPLIDGKVCAKVVRITWPSYHVTWSRLWAWSVENPSIITSLQFFAVRLNTIHWIDAGSAGWWHHFEFFSLVAVRSDWHVFVFFHNILWSVCYLH